MKIICENCGLNAAFAVVECTINELEATLNKMSGRTVVVDGEKKHVGYEPLSISGLQGSVFESARILILFKKTLN